MRRVPHVDPHARLGAMTRSEHGHDGVVGSHHVRSSHFIAHQLIKRFGQVAHVAAPDRLRSPRDLEPLPREDVFQSIVRKIIVELAGYDIAQQTWPGQPLVDDRLRLGRGLDLGAVAVALAGPAGVLLAHMMDTLEVARVILDLPAILAADFLTFDAAARANTFLCAQFVHMRGDGKVFEIRDPAPTLAPLHSPQLLLWLGVGRKISGVDRLAVYRLGETEK